MTFQFQFIRARVRSRVIFYWIFINILFYLSRRPQHFVITIAASVYIYAFPSLKRARDYAKSREFYCLLHYNRKIRYSRETRANVRPAVSHGGWCTRYAGVQRDNCTFVIWQTETTGAHMHVWKVRIHVFSRALIKLRVGDGYLFIFSTYEMIAQRTVST